MKIFFVGFLIGLYVFSASAAPQAVIFDCGGVMKGRCDREIMVKFFCFTFGFSREEFEKIHEEKTAATNDDATELEFWLQYADKYQIMLPAGWVTDFYAVMKVAVGVNPGMYELVKDLKKKHISVGMLSNVSARNAKLFRSLGLYAPFDPCLLSCALGIAKPDPRIYEILLETLGLCAQEVVFIDNVKHNIETACRLGIDAILFTSQEELEEELKARFN